MPAEHYDQKALQALLPSDKRYTVRLSNVPKLALQVNPSGLKVFYVITRREKHGNPTYIKVGKLKTSDKDIDGMSLREATSKAAGILEKVRKGVDLHLDAKQNQPIKLLFDEYYDDHVVNLSDNSINTYRRCLNILKKHFGNKTIKSITERNIYDFHNSRPTRKPFQNYCLTVLKSFYSWAIRKGYTDTKPTTNIKKFPERIVKEFLNASQIE